MTIGSQTARALPATTLGPELGDFFDHCHRISAGSRFAMIAIPAPIVPVESVLEVAKFERSFLWQASDGEVMVGLGSSAVVEARGSERFDRLESDGRRVLESIAFHRHESCFNEVRPLLAGGISFDVGAAATPPWESFGDSSFVLPRWLYQRNERHATLAVTIRRNDETSESLQQAVHLMVSRLSKLAAEDDDSDRCLVENRVIEVERPSITQWVAEVEAIRAAIASGRFEKIVAARCSRVLLDEILHIPTILRRLQRGLRSSVRFAFSTKEGCFFGATPERLIARRGLDLETEALAGSLASDEDPRILLESTKNLEEHRLVVDEIVARLNPLCERLEASPSPRIRELEDVIHLHTPIRGELRHPMHIIDLVARLHPTPAVGGTPTVDAMRWIAEHEPFPRGWYASPIGWFDQSGDGEFAVALRSCLATERQALVYAGAGIVESSDPKQEFLEAGLKEQALLKVLGRP